LRRELEKSRSALGDIVGDICNIASAFFVVADCDFEVVTWVAWDGSIPTRRVSPTRSYGLIDASRGARRARTTPRRLVLSCLRMSS
jgi:hypothetical protein